jgi:hypothetical protein
MTFEQAMSAAKNGSTVKRSSWTDKTVTYDEVKQDFNVHITRTINSPFTSNEDDMSATDWQTV